MNHTHPHAPSPPEKVRDPVCGMSVSPATAKWKHEHGGQTYYFCNPRCAERFRAEPDKYLASAEPHARHAEPAGGGAAVAPAHAHAHAPAAGIYTCPMHPEVRQEGPGACPKCGMALEPVEPVGWRGLLGRTVKNLAKIAPKSRK